MGDGRKAITVEDVKRDCDVLTKIGEALDGFEREQQLRILEAVCVLLREDKYAARFRQARLCDALEQQMNMAAQR